MTIKNREQTIPKEEDVLRDVERIETLASEIKKTKAGLINLSRPIVFLGDASAVYPNTITVIQGKTGTHKSHIAQNIVSAVIAKESNVSKTMGFSCPAPSDLVVVYIDTERNYREQFPLALQSILSNAGFRVDADPSNFVYYSFLEIPRSRRLYLLSEKLRQLREEYKGKHLLLVLDVITDFVSNFNDEIESMRMIDILNFLCNRDSATVVGVIHENPSVGSEKARGHLGTELANKATTVIQTKAVNTLTDGSEVFAVNFSKTRNDRKPKPIYMQYDETVDNLVLVASYKPVEEKPNATRIVQNAIRFHLHEETSKTTLVEKLCADTKLSAETVSKALARIVKEKLTVEHMLDGNGTLISTKKGKQVLYSIKPIQQLGDEVKDVL